ncbi:hypothetical protein RFI_08047 [Reticulomyxa filosa]|uniref:EF-hand domain-containing protein n=1 Tax=Reticulomyxa filosa TaxID=46433 RepID=X6NTJ6_RETFI|nr:hypothetical protein RFI_08047 [Reticulomyxa filosa]|eukprot:ETO29079.1 hypothetical protein RFI_08047 [Reticulomyxa filosa]
MAQHEQILADAQPTYRSRAQTVTTVTEMEHLLNKLRVMFEEADANNDKVLDFGEFKTLMTEWMPESNEEQLRTLFSAFDMDKSGEIKYTELLESEFFAQFLLQTNINTLAKPQPNESSAEMITTNSLGQHIDTGNSQGLELQEYPDLHSDDVLNRKVDHLKRFCFCFFVFCFFRVDKRKRGEEGRDGEK